MTPERRDPPDSALDAQFKNIVRDFGPRLYNQACRMLGDSEMAMEAVQDIFMNIHRSLRSFRGDSAVGTWIYRIAFNTLVSYRRRHGVKPLPLIDPDQLRSIPDGAGDVEAAYDRKEASENVARCIARLSPRESAAITLFYLEGFEYKEIAAIMETSISAVGLLLHRGRDHLRAILTGKREKGVF
jgi:RNA polymerase sigma-70 factor (ECF subfamily)